MSSLIPKSIGEMLDANIKFWIPSYRTPIQVIELLDDIWEFHKLDPKKMITIGFSLLLLRKMKIKLK